MDCSYIYVDLLCVCACGGSMYYYTCMNVIIIIAKPVSG